MLTLLLIRLVLRLCFAAFPSVAPGLTRIFSRWYDELYAELPPFFAEDLEALREHLDVPIQVVGEDCITFVFLCFAALLLQCLIAEMMDGGL